MNDSIHTCTLVLHRPLDQCPTLSPMALGTCMISKGSDGSLALMSPLQ